MANSSRRTARGITRELRTFGSDYRRLRTQASALRRAELKLLKRLESRIRGGKTPHLMTVAHRRGRPDRVSTEPVRGGHTISALSRARGGSGLFCGCTPIIIKRQPNDDIDICVLIECSTDPASTGFRCHYWCGTIAAPPVVAIARRSARRGSGRSRSSRSR